MTRIKNYLDTYVVGVYFYFLKVENNGAFSSDKYFAYTTILAVSAIQALFVVAIAVWAGYSFHFSNTIVFLAVMFLVLFVNWYQYIRAGQYVSLVRDARNRQSRAMRCSLWATLVMAIVWLSIPVYFVFIN